MTPEVSDAQRELDAYLRSDFVAFVEKVFQQLNPAEYLTAGWHILAMAHYVRVVAIDRQMLRLNINLPPRELKSTTISVALPAYLLGLDPRARIAVASYSQELSNMFGRQTRAVMQSPWYRRIFPSTRLSPRRQVEHDFHTTSGGFRFATSTGGTFTGRGADYIICDDLLKADDAYSDVRRGNMHEWTRTTLFNRLNNKKTGVIINVQQRLHEDDLSAHLIRSEWLSLSMPAVAEKDEDIAIGYNQLYHRRAGEPLDRERHPPEIIEQTKREVGSAIFSAQYQQSPTPADGNVIKMGWFKRYDAIPAGGQTVMSLDTASKVEEHHDFSAITVWRFLDGHYYLEFAWRGRLEYPELKKRVVAFAEIVNPDALLIEDKVIGTGLIQDLDAEAPHLPVIPYVPEGDKETRMRRHAARIEAGLVYLPREAEWLHDFELEVRQFPNGVHDDQVDSMSQALDYGSRPVSSLIVTHYRY